MAGSEGEVAVEVEAVEEEGVTEAEEATEVERAVAASGATGAVAASGTTAVAATAEESTGSLSPCKATGRAVVPVASPHLQALAGFAESRFGNLGNLGNLPRRLLPTRDEPTGG